LTEALDALAVEELALLPEDEQAAAAIAAIPRIAASGSTRRRRLWVVMAFLPWLRQVQ
jgi:ribosomal 50S subunit-associated protein YjgA (DUF615 family)